MVKEPQNRLSAEKSPYLLQHSRNPVDWRPWSEEAFQEAKRQDKPVFISIGYSTCHWCHVMAHESFEDAEVARLINDAFVPVKVDREERPDVDRIYMEACQRMTGRGGWPLTIVAAPDKRPFFAATYIPKEGRFGALGLKELIPKIQDMWMNHRDEVLKSSDRIVSALEQASPRASEKSLGRQSLDRAYQELSLLFDPINGGFGTAPKFPTPHNLMFLLRYWKRTGHQDALDMVEATLQSMRMGGIYDHLGFGFHRYSTDAGWSVPHFEKMLYDQALLTLAYLEAYQATGKKEYADTASEILSYVMRDMTSPEGGFYSAEDADSEGVEGRFYLWTAEELKNVLDQGELDLAFKAFDIEPEGNFHEGRARGENILRMRSSLEDLSSVLKIPEQDLKRKLDGVREKLFWHREKRVHPGKDDKILADWNGLMIAAFARAAQVLGREDYTCIARSSADFILSRLRSDDGRLLHMYRQGPAAQPSVDDYAFMIWGLLELYEATFEVDRLRSAIILEKEMRDHFWDSEAGGLYFTPDFGEKLIIRQKEIYDGAVPSGNSVGMLVLLMLSRLTGDPKHEVRADAIGKAFSSTVENRPSAYSMLLNAVDFSIGPTREVAIAGDPAAKDTIEMISALRSRFIPNKVVLLIPPGHESEVAGVSGFVSGMESKSGSATAYVCSGGACELPTSDIEKMIEMLETDKRE